MKRRDSTDSPSKTIFFFSPSHNRCCLNLIPCANPHPNPNSSSAQPSFWHRMRITSSDTEHKWWALPVRAFKKLRQWSEQVAGPKLKTFIRRFNCNRGVSCAGGVIATTHSNSNGNRVDGGGNFQYDALNYELNFDEGHNNGRTGEDDFLYPDFTSRYAVSGGALSTKRLMGSSREVNPVGG